MVWDQTKTFLAAKIYTGKIRIGAPPSKPGPKSTQQAVRGDPNGQTFGVRGDIAYDDQTPAVWQKTGSPTVLTTDGWVQLGTGGSSQGDLAYGLQVIGLEPGAQVGATDVTVLRFADQGTPDVSTLPLADWVIQTNDVEAGTTFQIILAGRYEASLSILTGIGPNTAITGGISLDATGLVLTGLPLMAFGSSVQCQIQNPSDNLPASISGSTPIFVTQEMIDQGLGIVRAHGANGATAIGASTGFVLRFMGSIRTS